MSAPDQSIEEIIPFVFFNAPNDSAVGTDALFDSTGNIDFNLSLYRLTDADITLTPGQPLLTVHPSECDPLLSSTRCKLMAALPLPFAPHNI